MQLLTAKDPDQKNYTVWTWIADMMDMIESTMVVSTPSSLISFLHLTNFIFLLFLYLFIFLLFYISLYFLLFYISLYISSTL